jgi:hypothetical protein
MFGGDRNFGLTDAVVRFFWKFECHTNISGVCGIECDGVVEFIVRGLEREIEMECEIVDCEGFEV